MLPMRVVLFFGLFPVHGGPYFMLPEEPAELLSALASIVSGGSSMGVGAREKPRVHSLSSVTRVVT